MINVPPGTVVIDEETGLVMKDLVRGGDNFVAARGKRRKRATSISRIPSGRLPNFAEAGGFAQSRNVILELKLIADVGLIGFSQCWKINSFIDLHQCESKESQTIILRP